MNESGVGQKMRRRIDFYLFLLSILTLPLFLSSQYLETNLFLPDSFGGFLGPKQMVWDSIRDRLYISGTTIGDRILVLDCARDEKLPPIEVVKGEHSSCENIFYNPLNNSLYAIYSFPPYENDSLFVIDCTNHQVVMKMKLPRYFSHSGFGLNTRENKVYLSTDSTFFIIDGETHQILSRVLVPNTAWGRVAPFLWNPINNKIYYIPYGNNRIYILDGTTGRIDDSVNTNRFPLSEIVPNERWNRIYIPAADASLNPEEFFLLILDCERNQIIGEVSLGRFLSDRGAICQYNPTNSKLYMISYFAEMEDRLKIIDLTTLRVDTIVFPVPLGWCGLTGIKYIPRHNLLYCFVDYDSSAVVIDGETNQIIDRIEIKFNNEWYPGIYSFYHPLRDKLYFRNTLLGVIDCCAGELIKEIYLGTTNGPFHLVLNPLTHKLYATEPELPIVTVFDVKKNKPLGYANFRDYVGPCGIGYGTVCTQMNKIYLSCGGGPILVLDGNTDSLLTVIWDIPEFKKLYYSAELNKIFAIPPCAMFLMDPYTYFIDCSTDVVIGAVRTGSPTYGFTYSPRTNKLYIASGYGGYGRSRTRIIDARTHQVIKVIPNICGDIKYDPRNERIYISDGWPYSELFQAKRVDPMRIDTFRLFRGLFILDGFQDSIAHYIPWAEGFSCALDTIDNRIYIASVYLSYNYIIKTLDLESRRIIDTIIDSLTHEIFWNPINNKLYYGFWGIKAMDCRTHQITWESPTFDQILLEIRAWYPDSNRLYLPVGDKGKLWVIRDEVSGIKEKVSQGKVREFKVSPTIGSSFNISWRGKEKEKVIIYNPSGRKVCEMELNPGKNLIWEGKDERDDKLPPGIYFLKLERDRITEKIILK